MPVDPAPIPTDPGLGVKAAHALTLWPSKDTPDRGGNWNKYCFMTTSRVPIRDHAGACGREGGIRSEGIAHQTVVGIINVRITKNE